MPDRFDPYREALVMETSTIWPPELDTYEPEDRVRLDKVLHAHPDKATNLTYIRTHSGFCRQITVTPDDLGRIKG